MQVNLVLNHHKPGHPRDVVVVSRHAAFRAVGVFDDLAARHEEIYTKGIVINSMLLRSQALMTTRLNRFGDVSCWFNQDHQLC